MHINTNKIIFYFLDKWRGNIASISFKGDRVVITGSQSQTVMMADIHRAPIINQKWLGSELLLTVLSGRKKFRIRGDDETKQKQLASNIKNAWQEYNNKQFSAQSNVIQEIISTIKILENSDRFPSACLINNSLNKAQELDGWLLSKLNASALDQSNFKNVEAIREFIAAPSRIRKSAIKSFTENEIEKWSHFFDKFETNPLTFEQRLSVVTDEDATLVLAGAGSGKTSVITAKAGYLIKSKIRKPEEVLLLAFARGAAVEMSERILEKCGEPVQASTFHALAYSIIGQVEGRKPALAAHATDDKAFLVLIRDILISVASLNPDVSKAVIGWFSSDRLEDKSEWDFKKKHDFYVYIEKVELRTLQGETVKSFEELLIANWLYENGVEYEYEPDYEYSTKDPTKRNYCPDFCLTESGVYLEHFGVRKKRTNGGDDILVTAPWIDRDTYLEGMEWKRGVHSTHDTTLIETYSFEREEGRLLEALATKIEPYVSLQPRSLESLFDRIMDMNEISGFVQLLANFLRNFKSGGYSIEECKTKSEKAKLGRRAKAFLTIFGPIFEAYEQSLKGRIDFEDMILRAAKYVETNKFRSLYGHILVDEFQDISRSRAKLVKALLSQRDDARLFAVGDDWQSIYRFAGSDIHLMRNFGAEFGGVFDGETGIHSTIDLGRTFRSVDKIAFAARRFILKNPNQLTKTVVALGTTKAPAIKIVSTFKHDVERKLAETLTNIQIEFNTTGKKSSVLLLGRYRFNCPSDLYEICQNHPNLEINFKTIHSSKGLEADHVILLQVFRGRIGFPSEIVDDPLLTMVSPEAEPFEHAEERRVMYVAMTRARKSVTIMASASRRSAFVSELADDVEYGVTADKEAQAKTHTCGDCQGHLLPIPKLDGGTFYRCEHNELCGNYLPACSACSVGFPERVNGQPYAICRCSQSFLSCPKCSDGWLIERKGRFGRFLSCVKYPRCAGRAKVPVK